MTHHNLWVLRVRSVFDVNALLYTKQQDQTVMSSTVGIGRRQYLRVGRSGSINYVVTLAASVLPQTIHKQFSCTTAEWAVSRMQFRVPQCVKGPPVLPFRALWQPHRLRLTCIKDDPMAHISHTKGLIAWETELISPTAVYWRVNALMCSVKSSFSKFPGQQVTSLNFHCFLIPIAKLVQH